MTVSATAEAERIVRRFEACRLEAYRDPVGLWTIGWGHLLSADPAAPTPSLRLLSDAQAEALLVNDLARAFRIVLHLARARLGESQAAALGSLAFNLGGKLRGSTLISRLNRGDYQGAADQIPKWI